MTAEASQETRLLLDELPNGEEGEGQILLFERALDETLNNRLGEMAGRVGLHKERLRERALKDQGEILSGGALAWEVFRVARDKERWFDLSRKEDEPLGRYLARLFVLFGKTPSAVSGLLLGVFAVYLLGAGIYLLALAREPQPLPIGLLLGGMALVPLVPKISRWSRNISGRAVAAEHADATGLAYLTTLETALSGWLRERINEAEPLRYKTELQFGDRMGLAEIDDPRHEIPTKTKERLLELIEDEAIPGGAIGLAGPRGAGKSTLMRSVCLEHDSADEVLGAVIDAPVAYDPRDFVLHLFATVCTEVVGPQRVTELRGRNRPIQESESLFEELLTIPVLGGVGLMVAGYGLGSAWVSEGSSWPRLVPLVGALLLFLSGLALTFGWLVREGPRRRRRRLSRQLLASGTKDGQTALSWLRQIWFQQSFSSGWSGSFKSPVGLEAGVSSGTELAERQMSFPEIVDSFRSFLMQISQTRQVRIGIDELDKMKDEDARRFLNEIKVVFRVPGCFFLISISEDAMSDFERRGLPIRDVLDSSFDDVVPVPYLPLSGSSSLLARRIVGLPTPFVCLLHCLSAGLPRDLIRVARKLVEQPQGISLRQATEKMVKKGVSAKAQGTKVAARPFRSEAPVTLLVEWLDAVIAAGGKPTALLNCCREVRIKLLNPLSSYSFETEEVKEIRSLGLQLALSAYFGASLVEFFSKFDRRAFVDEALKERGVVPSWVDRLAIIPQDFGIDLMSAWEDLSALRSEWDLTSPPYPGAPPEANEENRRSAHS